MQLVTQATVLAAFHRLKRASRAHALAVADERDQQTSSFELDLHTAAMEYARLVAKVARAGRA